MGGSERGRGTLDRGGRLKTGSGDPRQELEGQDGGGGLRLGRVARDRRRGL